MVNQESQVTINDVAKAAGVSKGTVDRVLHNRGEVSQKSKEKVLKVIAELGYKPNFYASILASQKKHRIVCIIPEYAEGDFWSLTAKGVEDSREAAGRYGITVDIVTYDQYEVKCPMPAEGASVKASADNKAVKVNVGKPADGKAVVTFDYNGTVKTYTVVFEK